MSQASPPRPKARQILAFGSVERRQDRVKPKRGSYLRRRENRGVFSMVLSDFLGVRSIDFHHTFAGGFEPLIKPSLSGATVRPCPDAERKADRIR